MQSKQRKFLIKAAHGAMAPCSGLLRSIYWASRIPVFPEHMQDFAWRWSAQPASDPRTRTQA
jgi:hypothetical protein